MKNQSKIIEELIKTLKENKRYVIEDKLNKTLIVDHAFQMNEEVNFFSFFSYFRTSMAL